MATVIGLSAEEEVGVKKDPEWKLNSSLGI